MSPSSMKPNTARNQVNVVDLKKLDPLDDALALMYFGWRGMTRAADEYLATVGLSRVHHRILYAVLRGDGITMSDLLAILQISKQALHRPMKQLLDEGYVAVKRDPARHRFKILELTPAGRAVERIASGYERKIMARAFKKAGAGSQAAWSAVMEEAARD
ncbi:MarR family winged helix-turn-helix transcriptional regulator [Bradyrhizobium sp. NFR13]|uniref:MarR family winged helix-turn-helix transcriptional regulator n=1 Tax=Bradyrhizobium sp. NFR13 TaxID=1566285 RepID=UPI002570A21A|nr:MarR family winged helix-turn-helix transcriptional regulator [Bradyrhizobium sp. NFR13]